MNKFIKILYIITLSDMGGAQAHLYELISNLPTNIAVYIIIGNRGWLSEQLEEMGIRVFIVDDLVRSISISKDIKAAYRIYRLIEKINPDIVHCHSSKAGILGRVAAYLGGVSAVFTAHGWAFTEGVSEKKRVIYRYIELLAGYFTKKIICVSQYDYQLAIDYLPQHKKKLTVIHNGIRYIGVKKHGQDCLSNLRLVMVARFTEQKDHMQVVYAMQKVIADNKKVHLSFIGEGPNMQNVKELVKKLHLESNISFLGQRENVNSLLFNYDVFLLASNWEGFPISILEAMRVGLPVIASDVGGVKEAVVNGKTGWLVPKGDANCLADKIKYCVDNLEKLDKIGLAGHKRFEELFTTKIMIEKVLAVYKNVIESVN
ncbi:glycosyltransferase family 4 protein [Pectinatus frisingensis]|uniref:glycosyltransferase family 4 protein n=1 Tax=Pectinatus frisingensis TaxID=865 RepID=UPI0018C55C03|nr:glycosyltransferase family 4 protein [Pectinatus frisingensis]